MGKSVEYRRLVGDVVHEALVAIANVPAADRFQIIEEVSPADIIADPNYAGANRSPEQVIIEIIFNLGRTTEIKKRLYETIAHGLNSRIGIRLDDVLIVLIEVQRENWSFAHGIAQYA